MRAGAAVLHQISLVGRDEEVARGNRDSAFRRNARRQELRELRLCAGILVNSGNRGALG
jgi:hypothetical protein